MTAKGDSPQYALFGEDPRITAVLAELEKTPLWDFDPARDEVFVRDLLDQFPTLDLVEQVQKWRAYLMDLNPQRKKVRPRARLRTWCGNAVKWRGSSDARGNAARPSGAVAAGLPGTIADHSPTGLVEF